MPERSVTPDIGRCGSTAYTTRTGLIRCNRSKGHAGSHSIGWRILAVLTGLSWKD